MTRATDDESDTGSAGGTPSGGGPSLAGRLHSVALHLLRHVRVADRRSGLTPARLSALSVLVFGGERSLGELASAEQVTAPTMSRLVEALAEQGLVTREPDPEDGRSVVVRATEEGRRLLEAGRDRRLERVRSLLDGLKAEELGAVRRACSALERALRAGREPGRRSQPSAAGTVGGDRPGASDEGSAEG